MCILYIQTQKTNVNLNQRATIASDKKAVKKIKKKTEI